MIIERLILHNFGPYHGRHVFELTPQPGKPVSLLIGMNGSGKTTVLQALQLAFYGAQAPAVEYYAEAGGCTFEDYLDQSISYWPAVEHSASVEVEFRAVRAGRERHHLLRRFWKRPPRDGSVVTTHKLEVFLDGVADPALASAWPEAIEELLPLPLSTLFFFDGEKIDRWANSLATAELVTQAVRSLLGLDVIDRAVADLEALQREEAAAREQSGDGEEQQAIEAALAELGRFVERRDETHAQLASAREELGREENKLKELEQQLQSRGLPLLNRRAELVALKQAREHEILLARERLRTHRIENDRLRRDRERWSEMLRRRDGAMLDAAPVRVRTWLETWLREQATRDFAVSPSPTDADAPAQPVGRASSRASSEATGGHPSPALRAPSPVGRERGGAGRPSASTQPEAWAARAPSPIGWERAGVRVRASAAAILPPVTPQTIAELETGHRELQALIDQIPDEATVTPLIATRNEHLRALERARLRLENLEAQARQVQPLLERAQARVAQLEEQRQRATRAQDQTSACTTPPPPPPKSSPASAASSSSGRWMRSPGAPRRTSPPCCTKPTCSTGCGCGATKKGRT